jgi:Aldolase/RraA
MAVILTELIGGIIFFHCPRRVWWLCKTWLQKLVSARCWARCISTFFDLPAAEKLGFQLFAGSVSVSHAYVHIVEFGTPVEIGGLKIQSGDLVHGDLHGVQTIPSNIAGKIPAAAAEIIAHEQELIALCQSKNFSVEKLRAALAKDRS